MKKGFVPALNKIYVRASHFNLKQRQQCFPPFKGAFPMRNQFVLSTAFAVVVALSSATNANAFFGILGCDCEPSCGCASDCCEPSCGCADDCSSEPSCGCAEEPSCGCADSCCDPCCKEKRQGCLAKLRARLAAKKCCDEASCGCADSCCEPSCGSAEEPSCGCADSCCDPCCKEKRQGCLAKVRARIAAMKCCVEASCGCADSCCEPSCGCAEEPSCGCAG